MLVYLTYVFKNSSKSNVFNLNDDKYKKKCSKIFKEIFSMLNALLQIIIKNILLHLCITYMFKGYTLF